MDKEVELILSKLKIVSEEQERGMYLCDKEHSKLLLDYINKLEGQLHQASLDIQELTERDIECPSWCDKLTYLQQENERLKEQVKREVEVKDYEVSLKEYYKTRIEKAVEYIENNEVCCLEYIGRNEITGNLEKQIQRDLVNRTDLLNILNGRSDE